MTVSAASSPQQWPTAHLAKDGEEVTEAEVQAVAERVRGLGRADW